jgi:hypothetical protein
VAKTKTFLNINQSMMQMEEINGDKVENTPPSGKIPQSNSSYTVILGVVPHACNPSYLRGRNKEDLGSRSAWAKSVRLYLKNKPCATWKGEWEAGLGKVSMRLSLKEEDKKN